MIKRISFIYNNSTYGEKENLLFDDFIDNVLAWMNKQEKIISVSETTDRNLEGHITKMIAVYYE